MHKDAQLFSSIQDVIIKTIYRLSDEEWQKVPADKKWNIYMAMNNATVSALDNIPNPKVVNE